MLNKILIGLLVWLNMMLSIFIIWHVSFFRGKELEPLQPGDSAKAMLKILEDKDNVNDLERTARYLVLVFVSSCDDFVAQQLSNYVSIQDSQLRQSINLMFIYHGADAKTFTTCQRKISFTAFLPLQQASQLASLAGIPVQHSAIFILDLQQQSLVTNYNYLLDFTVLKELIEVLP